MNEIELFNILFNTFYEKVYRSTYLIVQDESIAKDATQEAFIVVFEQLHRLKELDKIYTWIAAIASNKGINILKKNKRCIAFASIAETENKIAYHIDSMAQKENEVDIMKALKMLDLKHRQAIVLKYYYELNEKEIAKVLELPLGTVKSRLKRARIKLKKIMEPDTARGVIE